MLGYANDLTLAYDFFVYDADGDVWNGSAFVTWVDGDYQSYRVAATPIGSSGRFEADDVPGAATYELRERAATLAESYVVWTEDERERKLAEADPVLVLNDGVYERHLRERGTETDLIPAKTAKQVDGTDLTNAATQRLGGFQEEA